jgi:hypothetical protein
MGMGSDTFTRFEAILLRVSGKPNPSMSAKWKSLYFIVTAYYHKQQKQNGSMFYRALADWARAEFQGGQGYSDCKSDTVGSYIREWGTTLKQQGG